MNGDYNTYGNVNSPEDTTSVWVGNNTPAVSMEPLVDQFGNLRFGNQVIPLTTPVAPFLNQTPGLPNLTAASFPNPNTVQLPLNSPLLASQQTGQYYVVNVPTSSNNPPGPPNSVPTQTYVHQIPSPPAAQTPSPGDVFNVNPLRHVPTQNSSVNPYAPTSTQVNNPSEIYGVHSLRHVQTHKNYSENESNGVNRATHFTNGANTRSTHVSSPEATQVLYQTQRRSSDQEPPFRGQPYMKRLSIDSSNGEVIRSPERSVPPLVSSAPFTTQLPVGDNYVNERENGTRLVLRTNSGQDGTSTSSITSSASVSPYNSVPSSPRQDPGSPLTVLEADNKAVYDPVPPRYAKPTAKSRCLVCDKTVYAMEKRGPIKDDVLFHKGCFRCAVCSMMLDLKNFCQNPNDLADLNIYCKSHKPSEKFGKLDAGALSITRALQAPRLGQMNEQIRGGPEAMKGGKMDAGALNIRSALNVPKAQVTSNETIKNTAHSYQIDNQTVAMVHARSVPATELQVSNKLRTQVWSRSNRKAEGVPPPDVIRHDAHLSDYSGDPYNHDPPS